MKKTLLSISVLLSGYFSAFAQPEIVKDLNPGTGSSMQSTNDMQTMYAAGKIFFLANDGTLTGNARYYVTDGSEANTELLKDINASLTRIVEYNGKGYFLAQHHLNDGGAIELWETDGTPTGTVIVATVGTASSSTSQNQNDIFAGGNGVYFYADETTYGRELWFSDGTTNGTTLVKDFTTGTNGTSFSEEGYYFNNLFYFSYYNGSESVLATTDGTEVGTSDWTVSGYPAGGDIEVQFFVEMNNKLYFSGSSSIIESDGTESGTNWIFSGVDLSDPNDTMIMFAHNAEAYPVVMNNEFYFVGVTVSDEDETLENMLYKSDGTAAGTKMVKDIDAGSTETFAVNGNQVFFIGKESSTTGKEIWATDGTEAGTRMLKDIDPGTQNGVTSPLISVGDYVCFVGDGPAHGKELWQYDATNDITVIVADIHEGINAIFQTPNGSNPRDLINGGGTLYFRASENTNYGSELWKYTPYFIADTSSTSSSAPAQPTNLALTPTNKKASFTKMQLTWTDNADNETGFKVERSLDGSSWNEIADITTVNTEDYLDENLTPNTTYYYRVLAYNSTGSSSYSAAASASTAAVSTATGKIKNNSLFSVYPNPSNGLINILSTEQVKIYDTLGKTVYQNKSNNINTTINLNSGVYFVKTDSRSQKLIIK